VALITVAVPGSIAESAMQSRHHIHRINSFAKKRAPPNVLAQSCKPLKTAQLMMRREFEVDLPSVLRPRITTPISSQSLRNSTKRSKFRNPLLAIELDLIAAIQENDSKHKPTSSRKRQILFDAIEEIASISSDCQRPLLAALHQFRRPHAAHPNLFRTTLTQQASLTAEILAREERNGKLSRRISKLRAQIGVVDADTTHVRSEIEVMKTRVLNDNTYMVHSRELFLQVQDLNKQFSQIFVRETYHGEPEQLKRLNEEKAQMMKILDTKKSEFEIVRQLTRKLKFMESAAERK
jgi:hypothetical protein